MITTYGMPGLVDPLTRNMMTQRGSSRYCAYGSQYIHGGTSVPSGNLAGWASLTLSESTTVADLGMGIVDPSRSTCRP
jgi:hypothetical protein